MSRIWLDDDDELSLPTDVRSLVWAVVFFAIGMGTLIFTPPTDAGRYIAVGYVGILVGAGFLVKALRA